MKILVHLPNPKRKQYTAQNKNYMFYQWHEEVDFQFENEK